MTPNRIQDCWNLFIQGESEYFASATPIYAAVELAREERKTTGKRILITPHSQLTIQ